MRSFIKRFDSVGFSQKSRPPFTGGGFFDILMEVSRQFESGLVYHKKSHSRRRGSGFFHGKKQAAGGCTLYHLDGRSEGDAPK